MSSLLYCSSLDAVKTYLLGGNDLLLVIQFLRFYRVYGEDSTNIKTLPMFLNLSRCILFFGGKSATKDDLDIILFRRYSYHSCDQRQEYTIVNKIILQIIFTLSWYLKANFQFFKIKIINLNISNFE